MKNTILLLLVLFIIPCHGQQFVVKENISYVPHGEYKQQLDLYLPTELKEFPTVLFVHEGSLTSGDRKDEPYAELGKSLNMLGIACAVISYRLAPAHKWPSQPNDVASAFSWLKKNINRYGGDQEKLFLFGHSSGCLLVSLIGSDSTYLKNHNYALKDIAGIISMGCRLNDEIIITETKPEWYEMYAVKPADTARFNQSEYFDIYNSLSEKNNAVPTKHVSSDLPPMLILIGEHERFYPPILRDAAEFVGRALDAEADKVDIKILEDRTHMSAIQRMTNTTDPTIQLIKEFIFELSNSK